MASYRTLTIDGFTRLTVEGALDLEASRRILLDAVAEAGAAGQDLLIDLRPARSTLSFPDVYRLVRLLVDRPGTFSGRIAVLDDYDERFEKAQFFEFSASEAGLDARAFLDEGEAVAWLEERAR
jgi:hypothetical protein